jgi:hypothetical protein
MERESVMPISEFLHGLRFDPETTRAMGVAFKRTCAAFRVDETDPVPERVANKIIELADAGVRDPDQLCELALYELRRPGLRI